MRAAPQRDLVDARWRRRRGRRRSPRAGRGGTRRPRTGPRRRTPRPTSARGPRRLEDTAPAAVLQSARGTKNGESLPPATVRRVDGRGAADARRDDARRRAGAWASRPPASRTARRPRGAPARRPRLLRSPSARSPQCAATNDAPSMSTVLPPTRRAQRTQLSAAVPPRGDAGRAPSRRRGAAAGGGGGGSIACFCSLQVQRFCCTRRFLR